MAGKSITAYLPGYQAKPAFLRINDEKALLPSDVSEKIIKFDFAIESSVEPPIFKEDRKGSNTPGRITTNPHKTNPIIDKLTRKCS